MALSTAGLEGPDDLTVRGGGAVGHVPNGSGGQAPLWGVDNPMVSALSGLSHAVDRFAEAQDSAAVSRAQLDMRTAYTERYLNPESGEFTTRRGASAQGMYDDGRKFFSELESNIKKDMSPRQQRMFTAVAANEMSGYARQIASHQGTEILNYYKQENQVQIQKAIDLAAADPMNPDTLPQAFGTLDGLYRTRARYEGWSDEYAALQLKEAQGSIVMGMATVVSAEKPMLGLGLLKENREFVDPVKYAAMKNTLEDRVNAEQRRAAVESERLLIENATKRYTQLLDAQDENGKPSMSVDKVMLMALEDKDLAKDPRARHAVVNHLQWMEQKRGAIEKMRENIALKPLYDGLTALEGSSYDEALQAANDIIAQAPLNKRDKLQKYASNVLGNISGDGKIFVDNPQAYDTALLQAENGMPVNFEEEYGDRLTLKTLRNLKDKNFVAYQARERAAFSEAAQAWLGDTTQLKSDFGLSESKLYQRFLNMIPQEGFKDSVQRTKLQNEFFKTEILLKGVGGGL